MVIFGSGYSVLFVSKGCGLVLGVVLCVVVVVVEGVEVFWVEVVGGLYCWCCIFKISGCGWCCVKFLVCNSFLFLIVDEFWCLIMYGR